MSPSSSPLHGGSIQPAVAFGSEEKPYNLLVIGAGPHSLTLLTRLCTRHPSTTYSDIEHSRIHHRHHHVRRVTPGEAPATDGTNVRDPLDGVVVVDPHGSWMTRWKKSFTEFGIDCLRSPVEMTPDATDPEALRSFAHSRNRTEEITEIVGFLEKGMGSREGAKSGRGKRTFNASQHTSFYVPSTALFNDLCDKLVHKHSLQSLLLKASVINLAADANGGMKVTLAVKDASSPSQARVVHAKAVVVSIGHTNIPNYPPFFHAIPKTSFPRDTLLHSSDIASWCGYERACEICCPGLVGRGKDLNKQKKLLIVGGGLTAGHLAKKAAGAYDKVTLASRTHIRIKQFDISLPWVGRHRLYHFAKFWSEKDPATRLSMIQTAKQGGSLTPEVFRDVQNLVSQNRIELRACQTVQSAQWNDEAKKWEVVFERLPTKSSCETCTKKTFEENMGEDTFDAVWMATGNVMDLSKEPMFKTLLREHPIELVNGLPVLTQDLQHPTLPLFFTGGYATLELGPGSLNLFGAKSAAERITAALSDIIQRGSHRAMAQQEGKQEEIQDVEMLKEFIVGGQINRFDLLGVDE
ncbi:hypothetical protein DFJ77DRAFT_318923 [Powellomyces hirtus]|nr:hypothetical protein DFJ77DRAFT_318923 [Powellomyces hirtus]